MKKVYALVKLFPYLKAPMLLCKCRIKSSAVFLFSIQSMDVTEAQQFKRRAAPHAAGGPLKPLHLVPPSTACC